MLDLKESLRAETPCNRFKSRTGLYNLVHASLWAKRGQLPYPPSPPIPPRKRVPRCRGRHWGGCGTSARHPGGDRGGAPPVLERHLLLGLDDLLDPVYVPPVFEDLDRDHEVHLPAGEGLEIDFFAVREGSAYDRLDPSSRLSFWPTSS